MLPKFRDKLSRKLMKRNRSSPHTHSIVFWQLFFQRRKKDDREKVVPRTANLASLPGIIFDSRTCQLNFLSPRLRRFQQPFPPPFPLYLEIITGRTGAGYQSHTFGDKID